MPAGLFIGTSSWAEKTLVDSGRFYPEEAKDTPARLEYYSKHFNFAEIDSTYYALPSKKNIQRWADSVPDNFKFNVKAFALFTQHPTRLSSIPKSFHEALPEKVRAALTPKVKADRRQWNRFVITLKGDRLNVDLNGQTVIENARLPGIAPRGRLGLEHDGARIQFANLYVLER